LKGENKSFRLWRIPAGLKEAIEELLEKGESYGTQIAPPDHFIVGGNGQVGIGPIIGHCVSVGLRRQHF